MKAFARKDGRSLQVVEVWNGSGYKVYVDPKATSGKMGSRGGPEYPPHHCRFEDYGLVGGELRCKRCGLIEG